MENQSCAGTDIQGMPASEEIRIDLRSLWQGICSRIWLIIVALFLGGSLAFGYVRYFVQPTYAASFTAYINNRDSATSSALDISSVLSAGDLQASRTLAQTYAQLMKSERLLSSVAEACHMQEVSYVELESCLEITMQNDTEVIQINVTMDDPHKAYDFACEMEEQSPDFVESIIDGTSMVIVDSPKLPSDISAPSFQNYIILGVILGGLLGLMVVILWSLLDDTITDEEELSRRFSTVICGVIPDLEMPKMGGAKKKEGIVSQSNNLLISPDSPFAIQEAYKRLRTNVLFSMVKDGSRCIGVVSAVKGNGKSTNVLNLAISFAQIDKKVIVVDSDMRMPTIAEKLNLDVKEGLSDIVVGEVAWKKAVHHSEMYHFDVIAAGTIPPDATRLLESPNYQLLIDALKKEYDYVFFDLPPVLVASDASIVSKYLDGILLVVRDGSSRYRDVRIMLNQLKAVKAPIIGVAYVGVKERSHARYKRYYRQYYGGKLPEHTQTEETV